MPIGVGTLEVLAVVAVDCKVVSVPVVVVLVVAVLVVVVLLVAAAAAVGAGRCAGAVGGV